MTDFEDKDLEFVASRYKENAFDTREARARFHARTGRADVHRRWWMTAAAAAASVVLVVAAGLGVRWWMRASEPPAPATQPMLNPDVATTHVFVYDDVPLDLVLAELSSYYHCTLKASSTDKHLTGSFPDDDLDFIVSLIEAALDIQITVE